MGLATIISANARSSISQYGPECFPWDSEKIQEFERKALKAEEDDAVSQREYEGGVVVLRMLGPVGSVKYNATERVLDFSDRSFSTAILTETIAADGVLYYEAELLGGQGSSIAQFGFVLDHGFHRIDEDTGMGVGDNDKSWGVCGFRKQPWHDGSPITTDDNRHGWEIGDVIGFAVNVDAGKIAISKNGNWTNEAGRGVVFENVKAGGDGCGGIHPGLSSRGLKVRLNVLEGDFRFSKPSEEVWQSSNTEE